MNLSKRDDARPERALQWSGRSIAVCSRKELVDCIIHMARQLAIIQKQLEMTKDELTKISKSES